MKALVIYHKSDMDGIFSGLLMQQHLRSELKSHNVDLVGVSYGNTLSDLDLDVEEFDTVAVVDFSFSPVEMLYLYDEKNLIWVDHHGKAIQDSFDFNYCKAAGVRANGISAVKLVYDEYITPTPRLTEFVELLDIYDLYKQNDLGFRDAVKLNYYLASDDYPELLLTNIATGITDLDDLIDIGGYIQDYERNKLKKLKPQHITLHGYSAAIYNYYSNELVNMNVSDITMMYSIGERVTVSLRSKTIDVAAIARAYGGGGHKLAAGFKCNLSTLMALLTQN